MKAWCGVAWRGGNEVKVWHGQWQQQSAQGCLLFCVGDQLSSAGRQLVPANPTPLQTDVGHKYTGT